MQLETALLIVPPSKVQTFAYPLREAYDQDSFNRVPAHITLMYPFVPPDAVDEAVERLEPICASIPAFEITLDRYGSFENTLFLEPSNPEKILALHQTLASAFPEYPIYGGEHGDNLHPHLTLARFDNPQEAKSIDLPPAPSFTFMVKQIHLYLGEPEGETPFIPRAVIPFGDPE
jgi:2'-5' RNA ligase